MQVLLSHIMAVFMHCTAMVYFKMADTFIINLEKAVLPLLSRFEVLSISAGKLFQELFKALR